MRNLIKLIISIMIISTVSQAQVAGYYFKQQNLSYAEITGGTSLWSGTFDNEVSGEITIPSFTFNGTVYTSLYISANGFVTFGAAPTATNYTPVSNSGAYSGAVSGFGQNLVQAETGSPAIRYEQIGNEFVIQWKDVRRTTSTGEIISFQIRLNSSNNYINVVYGGTIAPGSYGTFPQVGLRGTVNTDYNNRYIINTGGNWINSTVGTVNSRTMYFNSAYSSTVPSPGLTFTWKPLYNPTDFTAEAVSQNQINLGWLKNSLNHNVMVAYNTTATFGTPVSGTTYAVTGTIGGGGTVLVYGGATSYTHTGLSANTRYYYKIWSYDAVPDYSIGDTVSTRTAIALPYLQDFNGTTMPGWSGTMSITTNQGTAGSKGLSEHLTTGTTQATTPLVGSITPNTNLSFHYRFVDELGYPLNATILGSSDKIEIQASIDDGATFTTIHTIDQNNHTATTEFTNKVISLAAYSGDFIKIRFFCTWGSGDYNVDIDNVLFEDGTNMSYSGSTTEQFNFTNVAINSTDNDIIRLQVVTQKSANPLSVTSITFNATGSISATNDISAAKIYYTTTPTFSTTTLFGTYSNPPNTPTTFTITGSQALAQGNNYFWLAYDIKPTASAGNAVDAQCTKFITSESGSDKIPTVTTITGNRKIGAEISGTKSIPTDYTTIAAAVTALNAGVVGSGGVTFNVAAGHTESSTAAIVLTQTGTSAAPIIFQKSGTGANPIVTHTGAGSVATTIIGYYGDGVIIIEGSDYVAFDGIDVTATNSGVEYGYYLRKASVTNGCSHVTIKSANITMTKGTSQCVIGFCSANNSSSSSNIPVTTPNGAHQNIVFIGNTISNVFTGIWLKGHATFFDQNYTIGTLSAGNTIQNYAGNNANDAYGIYIENINMANISYNNINNAAGGGSNFTAAGYGIYNAGISGNSFYALHNTINIATQAAANGDNLYGICSRVNGEVQIDYNTVTLSNSVSTGYAFYYISNDINTASDASYSISHNEFQGSDLNHTGSIYLINNVNSQLSPAVGSILYNATSGTINRTAASGGIYLYYSNGAPTGTEIIAGNSFNNISQSGTSAFYGITSATNAAHTHQVYDNTISNITNGSNSFTAIDLSTSLTRHIYGNQINNISTAGTVNVINIGSGLSTCHIYKNLITNVSSSSTSGSGQIINGILAGNGSNVYIYNNYISDLKAPSASSIDAIRAISITSSQVNSLFGVYYNSIYLNASSSATNFGTTGIFRRSSSVSTTGQLDMRNNIIVNISAPKGTGRTAVIRSDISNLANFSTLSDNNVLYAGTPGAARLIFYDAQGYQTLAAYQAYVTPREANSHSEDPPFVNVTTPPFDLHVQTTVPALAESAGQAMTNPIAITADYDADTREAAPDIGADEFEGISAFVENPGSFSAIPLSSQQTRLSFTANSSSDDVVLVFNNTGTFTPPAGAPVVNQPLAGGTVIYIGGTSPCDHSGLTYGTTYYYKAFSYDGASYSLGIAGNAAAVVSPVTGFTALALDQEQINLGWTKNLAGSEVIIASHSAYMGGNPVNGTVYNVGDPLPSGGTILYKGAATAFPHTGLATWSQHYYKCWSMDAYNFYSTGNITNEITHADPVATLPYLMNFSGTWSHDPAAPPNWKVVDVGGSGSFTWVRYTTAYLSAPASVRGYEDGAANDYLISPAIMLPAQDMQLTWYDKVTSATSINSYKVLLSATNNQISSFTTELGDFDCTNTTWTIHTIDLSAYQGQTVFIAFYQYYSQSTGQYFTIDDILIETLTPAAATMVFPNDDLLTFVNPLLKWTAPTSSIPVLGYKVYLDTSPDPTTLIYNGLDINFQTSGLLNNTVYYWKVVPYNINGDAINVPVWSFSTVRSNQLAESFEANYFPPVSWSLSQQFGWNYSITSSFHGAHSAVRGTTLNAVSLITPLLDISSGDKLEFFSGTSSSPDVRIQVIYSANKTNWTNLGDPIVVTVATWGFNSIDLGSLAGNDYYLAFSAYNTSGSAINVFLDHVTGPDVVPTIPSTATNPDPADLDAFIPTGPVLAWDPVVWGGIPSGYKVYFGTSPEPTTLVYNGANEFYQVGLLQLNTNYYWKVIPYNVLGDATDCPVWTFTTIPEGGVQIGRENDEYQYLPIFTEGDYSYTQTIYLQSEINISGKRIEKIFYQWNGFEEGTVYKDWVIYMGHTSDTYFSSSSDWVPFANLIQVFDGEVTIPDVEGWIEIILDTPFEYNNTANLVIAVDENTYGSGSNDAYFYGTELTAVRGLMYYDYGFNPDPASPPPADNLSTGIANLRLQCEDLPTGPVFRVNPASRDFSYVPIASESEPQVFTIKNNGIGTLAIQGVNKTGTDAGLFQLTDVNSYPVNLVANQSITVSVTFNPIDEGLKTASLSITHDASGSPAVVPLTGTGLDITVSDFPFTETFESNSLTRSAWMQIREFGEGNWTFATGAGDGSITTAHGGVLNARFTSSENAFITKLVSPVFDLTGVTSPQVEFWYGQEYWNPDQNELKIYYRTAVDQPWVLIFYDNTNRNIWTGDTLDLPNPTSTYQLAFEAIDNFGYANVLDDVTVGPPPAPTTTWTGSISDSWTNPANWTNGVPGTNYEAIIDIGSFPPFIDTNVTVYKITFRPGTNLIVSPPGILTVTGN